jgi:epoxyqueuosine reductase
VLDATRCISYLTIEYRGAIPEPLGSAMGAHVYGCDVCQEVCPWNAAAPVSQDRAWQPRARWDGPSLDDLVNASDEELQASLEGSAMRRARPEALRRNISIAAENARRTS